MNIPDSSATASASPFVPVRASLADFLGDERVALAAEARAALTGEDAAELAALGRRPVEFWPTGDLTRQRALLGRVGEALVPAAPAGAAGATTRQFAAATRVERSPLSTWGWFRVGENGRLYLATKSEHYQIPLGHGFPGYGLLEVARHLGIPNATHNNTRGHLTRRLEEELVRVAAPRAPGAGPVLDRVLNLQTGSLADEAAVKMILARYYRSESTLPVPPHQGAIPVFVVVGDAAGRLTANYHGTTIFTQWLRGWWPELCPRLAEAGLVEMRAVRPNSTADLERVFAECTRPPRRVAAFLHEIVMMNYGGLTLSREFLDRAYALCREHGAATVCDEIQSCLWAPHLFLYHEWGLRPDFVTVGKGFPGGEYAGSRLLFHEAYDNLNQFGALVTNGQEELAALAYLVTLRWAEANAVVTARLGDRYEERARALAGRHPAVLAGVDGRRHLLGISFHHLATARAVAARLVERGCDVSVQTYKDDAPPAILTKPPLTFDEVACDFFLDRLEEEIRAVS